MADYTPSSDYLKFQGSSKSSEDSDCCGDSEPCSCCPVGTIGVYDDNGEHLGCLTPSDAKKYINDKHIPEEGYVKVYHPTTGEYLGDLSSADAITYLEFLNNGTIGSAAENTFNIITPEIGVTGFVELSSLLSAGTSAVIPIEIDRIGLTDAVVVNLTNSNENITFDPTATAVSIPATQSTLDVQVRWDGIIVATGVYTFVLSFQTAYETKQVPFRLTLS